MRLRVGRRKRLPHKKRKGHAFAVGVAGEGVGLWDVSGGASRARDRYLLGIPLVGLLRDVRVARGVAARLHRRDVHVLVGAEHHGIFGDFVVVEGVPLLLLEPRIESKGRDGTMIAVLVDGPLGKDRIGVLGVQQAAERLVVGRIHDGLAIDLTGKDGAGPQDVAGFAGFRRADAGALR